MNFPEFFGKLLIQLSNNEWIDPKSIRIINADFQHSTSLIHFALDAREGMTHLCELTLTYWENKCLCKISCGSGFFFLVDVSKHEPIIWLVPLLRLIAGFDAYDSRKMTVDTLLGKS